MTHLPIHHSECRLRQLSEPHQDQAFHHYMNVFLSWLHEPQRRWFAALETMRLGHGSKHLLAQITGMSLTTILRGHHEPEGDLAGCTELHMRAPSGGRPAGEEHNPKLEQRLEMVLALETAGDPMGRRPKAKCSSLQHVSTTLKKGHAISRPTVSKLLRKLKYSSKVNACRTEVRGALTAERHEQFDHINEQHEDFSSMGDPIISVQQSPQPLRFLQSLPYTRFHKLRIMRSALGGNIMPQDGKHGSFGPLNIAIRWRRS